MQSSQNKWQKILCATGLGMASAFVLFFILQHTGQQNRVLQEWKQVPVQPPVSIPSLSQESIDLAVSIYGIDIPKTAEYPVFNGRLEDRGLSTRKAWASKIKVEIGPSAFSSWSLLGSTLSHELEVHCRQNFFFISLMDRLGLDGTAWAEREAYLYEIKNAKRFGLDLYHRDLISSTMSYYYSDDQNRKGLKAVLSRRLGRLMVHGFDNYPN